MRKFGIEINGAMAAGEVEPRTQLADFLRGERYLTGTHVGCEHGVCGACTVLIDGAPARSCITYAVACEGAKVTTIEGLRDDPIMADLRTAFSAHHALQCGYCTPGMLISCRDIVLRMPEADETRVRLELSGNLCRCTGYVGIVAAVQEVMKNHKARQSAFTRSGLGPVGARTAAARGERTVHRAPVAASAPGAPQQAVNAEQWRAVETGGVELVQSFGVPYPRDKVWAFFGDLDRVARCMPGARLTGPPAGGRAEGEVSVKLGPIVSAFAGVLDVERNDSQHTGTVRGAGRDNKSGSSARAIITYTVKNAGDATSHVDISVKFLLTGALAQFSRSGLVKDVADHLTQVFARNLEAALSGRPVADNSGAALDAASIARAAVWNRIRNFFAKLVGK